MSFALTPLPALLLMTALSPLAERLAKLDALHARRDDPAALAEARQLAAAAIGEAPDDYSVLWRAARAAVNDSEDPARPKDERARRAQDGYDLAQRAIAVKPNDVAGHYWAALAIGNWADQVGVLRALAGGVESKFKRPLERATALDVTYDHGNIPVVWGAYYLELPWPKRDRAKAAAELRKALTINPAHLRARLYLARIAADENRSDEARALLQEIAAAPADRYDPPDERRVKKDAAALAAKLGR